MAKESNQENSQHHEEGAKAPAADHGHQEAAKTSDHSKASKHTDGHHTYSEQDVEHVKNAILIDKYSTLYDAHVHAPWFLKLWHKYGPHHHHHAIINTDVAGPNFDSLSESEQVDRSLYALWKIHKVNPHFFAPSEQDIIEPREYRILRLTLRYTALTGLVGYLGFSYFRGRLNFKRLLIGATAFTAIKGANLATEIFYENAKMPSRRKLAKEYMQIYSPKLLFDVSRPNYPLEKLEHMHNLKHM
jgi:hypothetical protein